MGNKHSIGLHAYLISIYYNNGLFHFYAYAQNIGAAITSAKATILLVERISGKEIPAEIVSIVKD